MPRGQPSVPATPRVISPSPTPETPDHAQDSYLGPVTRSAARKRQTRNVAPQIPIQEDVGEEESDPELRRARTRSRSPMKTRKAMALPTAAVTKQSVLASDDPDPQLIQHADGMATKTTNGHLAPPVPVSPTGWNWRDFSRSPSPLGLIPIHRHFKTFIHKHEVPRKVLHVSIGFLVYWLYVTGTQASSVTPWLMGALIPIATTDYLRHTFPSLNGTYVRLLGAFMRESEYAGYNGVIFYLLGAWIVLYFFPKDVGVVSVMLLSWCDTAASTFGRLYGKYTPRIRRGKSLAGSLAAFLVGVLTAGWFWGWLTPRTPFFPGNEENPFMFNGYLRLPAYVRNLLGWSEAQATVGGVLALGVMSLWSGLVAAGSEVVDIFGWDDNLTIPVLSGIGIWGFLKVFG
jgi:diacylglycerol kinase (CTP)